VGDASSKEMPMMLVPLNQYGLPSSMPSQIAVGGEVLREVAGAGQRDALDAGNSASTSA
jgi:hypothetical protein